MYLISSEVDGVVTYYTADSSGILTSIGTIRDYSKGFTEDILPKVNTAYASLINGKLWMNTMDINTVTTDLDGSGYITSTNDTAINTKGYSGITSISPNCAGDCRFALSFDGRLSFKTLGDVPKIGTSKLLSPDLATRSTVATINEAYVNLWDANNGSYYTSNVPTNIIPIDFTSARKIRKFIGRLGADCILPVKITLEQYDTTSSSYKELSSLIVNVTDTEFEHSFENSNTISKYQFKIEYTDDGSGKSLSMAELNMYEEVTGIGWITCTKESISTNGMSVSTMTSLTSTQIKDIFVNTQMDYMIFIPSGGSFTALDISFPANSAPTVTEFVATPGTIHSENVLIGFRVMDAEDMSSKYKVLVNDVELYPYTPVPTNGYVFSNISIPNNTLTVGTNKITIVAEDELGADKGYDFYITKVDNLPGYVGSLVGHTYTINVSDIDGDAVKFKTELNGKLIELESALISVPFSHTTVFSSKDLIIGKENTLKITLTDSVGGVTVVEEKFVGDYEGLLFQDEFGNYLSSELGEVLQNLDFGPLVAGYNSLAKEVQVINKTKDLIPNLVLTGPKDINGKDIPVYENGAIIRTDHQTGDIFVKLSDDDTFVNATDSLPIKNLNPGEKTSFYVKVFTSNRKSIGDLLFNIQVTGK